jgi:hypothetical protein
VKRTTVDIRNLVDRIDRRELRLPEIQRGYVWKPPKVAALMDSLYRGYPSGSLLVWETSEGVEERVPDIDGPSQKPMTPPQYLIDGQQRLTSLHRVFSGHEAARVVFNVETQRFQNESAATKKDPRWIYVHELLSEEVDTYTLIGLLREKLPDLEPKTVSSRLDRLRRISDYTYFVEIIDDLGYDEVADIFVRVNSRGVALRAVDLALATLSARWRGVVAKLEEESSEWRRAGYPAISVPFLARCLAALATESGTFRGFAAAPLDALEEGWERAKRGVAHLVPLLKNNGEIATSELLPSDVALIPLVSYLGLRPEEAFSGEDADALLYWLFGAFIRGRYSGSSETVLAQDLAAVRSPKPTEGLFRNLGLLGERLVVTSEQLAGRGANSPYFLLSYLAAQHAGARDWWYGVDICTDAKGTFKLEYHHIHPRATLKTNYQKAEINDLANLAFISSRANKKISDREPEKYFPELGESELRPHLVPLAESLRVPDAYPEFVRERRQLLANAMTELLERFRPKGLTAAVPFDDPATGERLTLQAFGSDGGDEDAILRLEAFANGDLWAGEIPLRDFISFVGDLEDGNPSGFDVGGDYTAASGVDDGVEIPVGPLLVTGTIRDWREVLDRELMELSPLGEKPPLQLTKQSEGDPRPFPILDSE